MNKAPEHISPPHWALRLLRIFIKREYLEEIEGDLEETFEDDLAIYPLVKAKRRFYWQLLMLLRPALLRKAANFQKLNHYGMFKHSILMSLRGFKRHKLTFFINLIGLSTGLAASLLIYLWVNDERSVDTFHDKNDQLHWVMTHFQLPESLVTWDYTSGLMAENMKADFPEVLDAVRVSNHSHRPKGIVSFQNDHFEVSGLFAGSNFFDVLSYDLFLGNSASVLSSKETAVISRSLAEKMFGTPEKALNQTIHWENRFFDKDLTVNGVFEDPPANATQQFEILINYRLLTAHDPSAERWNGGYAQTYLLMQPGTDMAAFNRKIADYMNIEDRSTGRFTVFTRPYASGYLFGDYKEGVQSGGRIENVRLFTYIAIFILLIACINFMNLSTAQASKKMKEIGVKKAIGAYRHSLIGQFLCESVLLAFLALVLALAIVFLSLPQFSAMTNKTLQFSFAENGLSTLFIVLATGLLAGSYPAFYLSGFKPVAVLKGKISGLKGEEWIRKGLVTLQFSLSIIFIIGVLVINRQIEFTQNSSLGYDGSNIVKFTRKGANPGDPLPMLSELNKIPGVVSTANMAGDFLWGKDSGSGYSWQAGDDDDNHLFKSPKLGYNAIETLGIEVLAGRSFHRDYQDDRTKIMVNESAVKLMGLENPVGTKLGYSPTEKREIIGVVKDFQYGSMHQEIEPMVIRFREWGRDFMVKIQPGTEVAALQQIESVYKQFHPQYDFEASFMTDDYNALYDNEEKVAQISNYMAAVAILVSCLGLFGLVAFTAERKTKEIGIRKVLGASRIAIMKILSKSFAATVLMAVILAIPAGYYLADGWLQNFAYSIHLNWWIFAFASLMAMLIAWLTVSFQTLKAAKVNPVECLRHE